MSTRSTARLARRRSRPAIEETISEPVLEIPESATGTIACPVTCQRKWGAYISTPEQREKKEQPAFLAGYDKVSELEKDARVLHPEFEEFVDYGTFWSRLQAAGIEKPAPEKMPHREDR